MAYGWEKFETKSTKKADKKLVSLILPPFRKKSHSWKSWFAPLLGIFVKKIWIVVTLFIVLFPTSLLLFSFCSKCLEFNQFWVLEMWSKKIFFKISKKWAIKLRDVVFWENLLGWKMVKKTFKTDLQGRKKYSKLKLVSFFV